MNWICCQIGAREHYAVARALNKHGALERLVTDAWARPREALARVRHSLRERFHVQLASAQVSAANREIMTFEVQAKIRRLNGWSRIIARNKWFQEMATSTLSKIEATRTPR